jgi:hypothetical protein
MTRTSWILGWLAPLALGACATHQPKPQESVGKVSPQMRSGSTELRAYQIVEWIAPDDRTLILNAMDRSLYEGRFRGQCTGLRLVDTIAFIVPGPQEADRYSGVVLPDGRRCTFKSFTRLATPPADDSH